MSPDDPNADTNTNTKRRLGLMRGRPPLRLDEPDLNSGCEAIPARSVPPHQDHDDVSALGEYGLIFELDCDGTKPPVRRDDPDNDDDLDEPEPLGATASLRLMVVPGDAEREANALRYLEMMLGQMLDHTYSDNLDALRSAEVDRDAMMSTLPERVFTVKIGSHTLITDHPNVMRLLAPWLELHRTTAADLPEGAHRINVALTLTPAQRLV